MENTCRKCLHAHVYVTATPIVPQLQSQTSTTLDSPLTQACSANPVSQPTNGIETNSFCNTIECMSHVQNHVRDRTNILPADRSLFM